MIERAVGNISDQGHFLKSFISSQDYDMIFLGGCFFFFGVSRSERIYTFPNSKRCVTQCGNNLKYKAQVVDICKCAGKKNSTKKVEIEFLQRPSCMKCCKR